MNRLAQSWYPLEAVGLAETNFWCPHYPGYIRKRVGRPRFWISLAREIVEIALNVDDRRALVPAAAHEIA